LKKVINRRKHKKMKTKIFTSMTGSSLEKKVNTFLESANIEVFKVEFQATTSGYAALILYKEKK